MTLDAFRLDQTPDIGLSVWTIWMPQSSTTQPPTLKQRVTARVVLPGLDRVCPVCRYFQAIEVAKGTSLKVFGESVSSVSVSSSESEANSAAVMSWCFLSFLRSFCIESATFMEIYITCHNTATPSNEAVP